MKKLVAIAGSLIVCLCLLLPAFAQETKPIKLPEPKLDPGKSLAQALKDRKSTREYANGDLSPQVLSNLLWAAFGINRPDGKRTAPSSFNRQEISVYVATAKGLFVYDAKDNTLVPVVPEDLRQLTGTQSYFKDASVDLVYVSDLSKMGEADEAAKMLLTSTDTGFIAQNVYLYCASEGLSTVFRAAIDKPKLAAAMKLKPDQKITYAQTVGLPKSK